MSNAARWTTVAWVPLFAGLVSAAWFGSRSIMAMYLHEVLDIAGIGQVHLTQQLVGMLGMLLAGGVALLAGPVLPAVVGSMTLAVGLFLASALPPEGAPLAFAIAALGHGMLWPSLFGAAARALRGERENLRVAMFLVAYLGINAGSFAGTVSTAIAHELGYPALFGLCGGVAALACLLSIVLGAVALMTRRSANDEPEPAFRAPHLMTIVALIFVCVVPWAAALTSTSAWYVLVPDFFDRFGASASSLHTINPIVVIAVSALLAVVFFGLHAVRARVPPLLLAGIGLTTLGLGAAITGVVAGPETSIAAMGTATFVSALGEALFLAPFLSRVSGDLPYRLETGVIALWSLLTRGLGLAFAALGQEEDATRAMLWLGALSALVAGVALAIAALPLRRVFVPKDAATT